jgi:hypothetical protein
MNLSGQTWLCLIGWGFTLARIRTIHWKDVRRDGGVALNIWLMMFFFTVTLTFLGDFGGLFDAHTINNLSKLIAYPSILITIYLAAQESLKTIDKPSHQRIIRQLGSLLVATNIALLVIYALFLWKVPEFTYVPRSVPEALFRFIAFIFGGALCIVVARTYLAYFPLEEFATMRLRALMVILCAISTGFFFLVRIAQVAGYFLPLLASAALNNLSIILLVLSSLLYFTAFLSDKIYVQFMVISRNIRSWSAFQDLEYLTDYLLRLCPIVTISQSSPSFWRYLLNPEYYLYRAVIIILDGKTMLADFLSETGSPGEPDLWEGDALQEAVRLNTVLQSINPSDDFWDIVGEYRRAKDLLQIPSYSLETSQR